MRGAGGGGSLCFGEHVIGRKYVVSIPITLLTTDPILMPGDPNASL